MGCCCPSIGEYAFGQLTIITVAGRFLAPAGGWSTNPDTATRRRLLIDGIITEWLIDHASPQVDADVVYTVEVGGVVVSTMVVASGASFAITPALAIPFASAETLAVGVDGSALSVNRSLRTTATIHFEKVR